MKRTCMVWSWLVLLTLGAVPVFAEDEADTPVDNVAAANDLRLLGAVVHSDSKGFIREVNFAYSKTKEDVTKGLKGLTKIEVLDLSGMQVDDEGLKNLKDLVNVEILVLARTNVTDGGLEHLTEMKKMVGLDLSGTGVAGDGLEHIQGMKELRDLYLDKTEVKDEHLLMVSKMPELKSVSVVGAKQISQQGITKLKRAAPKLIVVR